MRGFYAKESQAAIPHVSLVRYIFSNDSVQLSESFGGPHGTEFSDQASVSAGQAVSSITIRAGERVDGISLEVTAPKASVFNHGGAGGTANSLKLAAGEYITSMEAHWGKKSGRTRIFYLSFGTSAGNSVSGGSMTEDKNTVTAPEGFQLGGFFGRGGDEIDSLGAIWARIAAETTAPATKAPPAPTKAPDPPKPVGSGSIATSESSAATTEGSTSKPEDPAAPTEVPAADPVEKPASGKDAPSAEPVDKPALGKDPPAKPATTISVEDSVQLSESFGELMAPTPKATTFDHGGSGGKKNTLTLAKDEYITSMEVHWGKKAGRTHIFYLSFGTSARNSVFGGTQTEDKNSVTAPKGFQLGGFFGRDGDELDSLGAIWTSIEVVTAAPTEAPAPAPAPKADETPGTVKPAGTPKSPKSGVKTTRAVILSESFGGPHSAINSPISPQLPRHKL
ncbi:unnamed protein product [Phytophthora fragariaefolia]|uniref:Unnamed protein product n=1 Tax=Phytophthora fragariaefolia TaxID=1490495 RepID=A0A9W6XQK8_9STRA|nr:unnamed protein product [Phytophthora fragariaefolia]